MKTPLLKRLRRFARYCLIRALLMLLRPLPLKVASTWGEYIGQWIFVLVPSLRHKALASVAVAFPEWTQAQQRQLAQAAFKHVGRTAMEMACIAQFDAHRHQYVDWPPQARAVMDKALAQGRGVVFVTGHVGNWEVLARFVAQEGYPAYVIGKETSDEGTTKLLERFRHSGGLRVIWRGRPGAAKDMLRALKRNAILGLLIDQDTKVQSVWVPFFGRLAKTPRAAADLALRTHAVPLLGFCIRTGPLKYRISMKEVPLPPGRDETAVHALTEALTLSIEEQIRTTPEQWVWFHQRWKSPKEQS